jgi:non-canonical poly(A) RNA polymerase PAPD5/7
MRCRPGVRITDTDRKQVASALWSINKQLARCQLHTLRESKVLDRAKVPIIKTRLGRAGQSWAEPRVPADVSLGVLNGAEAIEFVHRQQQALPPLRPLVLFLKSLLSQWGLNEAASGGLSSFALTNMVRERKMQKAAFGKLSRAT